MSAPGLGCVETASVRGCKLGIAANRPIPFVGLGFRRCAVDMGAWWGLSGASARQIANEQPHTRIAAISGRMPMMFMTRVRL
jgi:hypothetical protein